jgi:hypothetical protein
MSPTHDPLDVAWRVLGSNQDRIGAVDVKAGICLSLEAGVLTAAAALAGTGAAKITAPWTAVFAAGAALLAAAILAAISVITPRTNGRHLSGDLLYFGNLRALSPAELAERLRDTDLLTELSRQIVHTSAINWTKHTRLRLSLRLAANGLALIVLPAMAAGLAGAR